MSAELLRKAATLMRQRAAMATPGPWLSRQEHGRDYTDEGWSCVLVSSAASTVLNSDVATTALPNDDRDRAVEDAEHIASWHPSIAEAVACWLEGCALRDDEGAPTPDYPRAREVAATYLGGAA